MHVLRKGKSITEAYLYHNILGLGYIKMPVFCVCCHWNHLDLGKFLICRCLHVEWLASLVEGNTVLFQPGNNFFYRKLYGMFIMLWITANECYYGTEQVYFDQNCIEQFKGLSSMYNECGCYLFSFKKKLYKYVLYEGGKVTCSVCQWCDFDRLVWSN